MKTHFIEWKKSDYDVDDDVDSPEPKRDNCWPISFPRLFVYYIYLTRQMKPIGSKICLFVRLGFLSSGPDRGRSPVEWGDFPFVRPSIHPSVRPSVPPSGPASQA